MTLTNLQNKLVESAAAIARWLADHPELNAPDHALDVHPYITLDGKLEVVFDKSAQKTLRWVFGSEGWKAGGKDVVKTVDGITIRIFDALSVRRAVDTEETFIGGRTEPLEAGR